MENTVKKEKKVVHVQLDTMHRGYMEQDLQYGCGFTSKGRKDENYFSVGLITFAHRDILDVNRHEDWTSVPNQGFSSFEEHLDKVIKSNPKFHIVPVWLFQHGQAHLEWSPSCQWDSGALGCLAVRRKRGARTPQYETAIEKAFDLLNGYWFSPVYTFFDEVDGVWVGPLRSDDIQTVAEQHFPNKEIEIKLEC